ncbi:MAG: hypothetical protein QXW65_00715 [Candidatus Pacearchaeota archaeon]
MSHDLSVELAKYFLVAKHKKRFSFGEQIKQELEKIIPRKRVFQEIEKINVPDFRQSSLPYSFDLGRINVFIQDPSVSLIQCDGPNIPLKINKNNEMIQTDMALNEDEINSIINKFSLRSGKPIAEPVFQAQANGLRIMAIISRYAGSRFIITKI